MQRVTGVLVAPIEWLEQYSVWLCSEYFYWYRQAGYDSDPTTAFRDVNGDGGTNSYVTLLKRNTSTNDSFYKQNHGFQTNDSVQLCQPLVQFIIITRELVTTENHYY